MKVNKIFIINKSQQILTSVHQWPSGYYWSAYPSYPALCPSHPSVSPSVPSSTPCDPDVCSGLKHYPERKDKDINKRLNIFTKILELDNFME